MAPTSPTNRLALRPLESADAEALHFIDATEQGLQYFPPSAPPSLEKVQRFVVRQQEHWDEYGYGHRGVIPKGGSQIIGWAGLQFLPELNETENWVSA